MTRQIAVQNVTMDRFQHHQRQRPILSGNKLIPLNVSKSMTDNLDMPQNSEKTSRRVVLIKGEDHWRFEWQSGQELEAVEAITEIVNSPDTDFDWFDAAIICHEMSRITSRAA